MTTFDFRDTLSNEDELETYQKELVQINARGFEIQRNIERAEYIIAYNPPTLSESIKADVEQEKEILKEILCAREEVVHRISAMLDNSETTETG